MKRINTNPHIAHHVFKRNKNFPNSKLPVIIYEETLQLLPSKSQSALVIQKIFARNGWSNFWKNGIYDFHHYHSNTHETMAVSMGDAVLILGGPRGKRIKISRGDVIIIPAGVGHCCIKHSPDFQCVGAYPQGKNYDINLGRSRELVRTMAHIKQLSIPSKDPVFGKGRIFKNILENIILVK